jgi:hypothetical protein
MKLYFFSLLAIFFLLLSDPDGSGSCGRCDSYLHEVGVLPDTTLTLGNTWEVMIKERLWKITESCEGDYYGTYVPQVTSYTSNSNVKVSQQGGVLFLNAKAKGTSTITLVAGAEGSVDPTILSQTIKITVK